MKVLSFGLLVLTAVTVACAPQRRSPTVKSTKIGEPQKTQQVPEKALPTLTGAPVVRGDISKLTVPEAKTKTGIKSTEDIIEVTAIEAKKEKLTDVPGFKIEVKANTASGAELVTAVVDNKPGQELNVSSATVQGKKRVLKTNAKAVELTCLESQGAQKLSDCKKLKAVFTLVGEKEGIIIEVLRVLSAEVNVDKKEAGVDGRFGRAHLQTFVTRVNNSQNSKTTRVLSIVGDNQDLNNEVTNSLKIDGVDTKIAVAGLISSSPIASRHSLVPKSAVARGDVIEVTIGVKEDSADAKAIAKMKSLDDELNLKLIVQSNSSAPAVEAVEKEKVQEAVEADAFVKAQEEEEVRNSVEKAAAAKASDEQAKENEKNKEVKLEVIKLPKITVTGSKSSLNAQGSGNNSTVIEQLREEAESLQGLSGNVTAP